MSYQRVKRPLFHIDLGLLARHNGFVNHNDSDLHGRFNLNPSNYSNIEGESQEVKFTFNTGD